MDFLIQAIEGGFDEERFDGKVNNINNLDKLSDDERIKADISFCDKCNLDKHTDNRDCFYCSKCSEIERQK